MTSAASLNCQLLVSVNEGDPIDLATFDVEVTLKPGTWKSGTAVLEIDQAEMRRNIADALTESGEIIRRKLADEEAATR